MIGKTTELSLALVAALLVVAIPGIDAKSATSQNIMAEEFLTIAEKDEVVTLDADYALTTTLTTGNKLIIDARAIRQWCIRP